MDEENNPMTESTLNIESEEKQQQPKREPMKGMTDGVKPEDKIQNQLVLQGVKKAQMLLAYGAEQGGLPIEKKDIQVFTNFKQSVMLGEWTAEEEADFWEAYSNIAKALGNVKAKEIEAITTSDKPQGWLERTLNLRTSPAQRVANAYTIAALFFVVIMLIVQVYSLVGNNFLNKALDIQKEIVEQKKTRSELETSVTQNGGKVHFTFSNRIKEDNGFTDTLNNPQKQQIVEAKFKLKELNYDLWVSNMELITTCFSLNDWLISKVDISDLTRLYNEKDSVQKKYGFYKETLYMKPEEAFVEQIDAVQHVLTAAKSPLDVMNLYILPLLYGLIGAFAYVLRNFTEQLESIDYSRDSNIKFLLRLFLGALVGLTVRMFFDTNDTSGLAMYSPLAISFICGYSVEFFFAMVDSIIKKILPDYEPKKQMSKEF